MSEIIKEDNEIVDETTIPVESTETENDIDEAAVNEVTKEAEDGADMDIIDDLPADGLKADEDTTDAETEGIEEETESKPADGIATVPSTENAIDVATEQTPSKSVKAAQRTSRRPRATHTTAKRAKPDTNYMGDYFEVASPLDAYKEELEHIRSVISHNAEVSRTGRGEYQYITAMMTSNDEVRENNDPNRLSAVHVYAVEVMSNRKTLGTLRLVFTGEDFTAYSGMVKDEEDTDSDILRRQRRYTNHAPMSKFQCVPVQILENEGGQPSVICSRAFAMEKRQEDFFFGDHASAKVNDHATAYIMSVDNNGVRVECMGIETRINRGQLTARHLITDATEYYKPGMAIDVAIRELEVDKENRTVMIRLSGILREVQLGLAKSVKDIDLTCKPHEVGQVVTVTQNYYIVRLVALGIIGIIKHENVQPQGVTLSAHDNVFMEITGKNEKYNRVIGNCYKI